MVMEIKLTKGHVAIVDDDDFERVNKIKWYAQKTSGQRVVYAINPNIKPHFSMHRFILDVGDGHIVDHADGNGLNNTKKNLRICTYSQNLRNKTVSKNSTTGYKGAYRSWGKFCAIIGIGNRRNLWLGTFDTAEEAARAYDAKARELFGEFARCNFED